MAAKNEGSKKIESRQQAQITLILDAFNEPPNKAAVDPANWRDTGEVKYIYREGSVLVRDRDLDRVRDLFRRARRDQGTVHPGGISGLTRYDPPGDFEIPKDVPLPPDLQSPTLRNLVYIDYRLGVGVATPDHLLYVVPVQAVPGARA